TGATGATGADGATGPTGATGADAEFTPAAAVATLPVIASVPTVIAKVNEIITALKNAGLMET
ncbi:MAG TPA: hypothetical protein DCO72_08895, partial [Ruminococcus sp.]|nr:hypothetical protein [Ruminococcus sp.]